MNTVTVQQRGEVTLPKEIRDTCHLEPGVTLSVVPIGEIIMLIPGHSHVGKAAAQLENLRKSAGLTVEQMLEGLDEERERYYQECYRN